MKFNVPTKLTFLRLFLALLIIFLLLFPFHQIGVRFPQILFQNILIDTKYLISGVIFIIASLTDYFDGKLARKNNEVTNFGKMIDAIADKVLVNSILIIFACQGYIPAIVPTVIVVRDIIVDAIKMSTVQQGSVQAAIYSGKLKTASLMVGMVLIFAYNLPFEIWNLQVADFFIYFGTIMAVISMVEYYNINKKVIFLEFEKKKEK